MHTGGLEFKERIRILDDLMRKTVNRERPMGMSITIDNAALVEMACQFGFDWFLVDTEHTEIQTFGKFRDLCRAADVYRKPMFIKLAEWDREIALAALDSGAYGLCLPFVSRKDQLLEYLDHIQFPPKGSRGYCSIGRNSYFGVGKYTHRTKVNGEVFDFANNHQWVIPTLETTEALANLDDLMSVDEIKIWHIGFQDLALSLGHDLDDPNDVKRSLHVFIETAKRIREKGKLVCTFIMPVYGQTEDIAEGIELIGSDFPYALDAHCLGFGYQEIQRIQQANQALRKKAQADVDEFAPLDD